MKKIIFTAVLFFSLLSFGQEKKYNEIFKKCEDVVSKSSCVMYIIEDCIQLEYLDYRETTAEKYDLEQIQIKYIVNKEGSIILESLKGNFENFRPVVEKFFKKLPKVQPVIENGKSRDAAMTTSFYLFPKKK